VVAGLCLQKNTTKPPEKIAGVTLAPRKEDERIQGAPPSLDGTPGTQQQSQKNHEKDRDWVDHGSMSAAWDVMAFTVGVSWALSGTIRDRFHSQYRPMN